MRDYPPVTDLVTRARTGDKQAWDALVERYIPLVWSICARYRLAPADAADASQLVWLRLVEQLDNLRDPAAVADWLATTTRHECARVAHAAHRPHTVAGVLDADTIPHDQAVTDEEDLLDAERHAALRAAFACLPTRSQQLLTLLTADPPTPYAQISATLAIPVGSIGPLRDRCLHQLRGHPAIAALISAAAYQAPASHVDGSTGATYPSITQSATPAKQTTNSAESPTLPPNAPAKMTSAIIPARKLRPQSPTTRARTIMQNRPVIEVLRG